MSECCIYSYIRYCQSIFPRGSLESTVEVTMMSHSREIIGRYVVTKLVTQLCQQLVCAVRAAQAAETSEPLLMRRPSAKQQHCRSVKYSSG